MFQHRADGLLVLSHRLVVQGVAVPVEGVRVVRALAHVQADPHVDVVRGHHRSSRHEGFPGRRGLGGVRTSGAAPTLRRDLRHAPLKRPCSRPGSYQRSSGVPAPGDNTPPGSSTTGRILVVVATPVCFAALDGGLGLVRLYHAVLMSSSIFSDGFL